MASQYEGEKDANISGQNGLQGLHMVQFECPKQLKPSVLSNLEVGRFPSLNYWPSGVIGEYFNAEAVFRC